MMIDVAILLFAGSQISTAASMAEIFWIANKYWRLRNDADEDLFRCRVLSQDGKAVKGLAGITLNVDGALCDAENADIIYIPGVQSFDFTAMLAQIGKITSENGAFLRNQHSRGAHVAASCSSVFILGESGLLKGREATVSWWLNKSFRQRFCDIDLRPDQLVTDDDRVHCAGGFTASLNLGLKFIDEFSGADLAQICAGILLIDANRASQLPYAVLQDETGHQDSLVGEAQHLMRNQISGEIRIDRLAEKLGATTRTLTRRFVKAVGVTPLKYLQRLRVEQAKRLLSTTDNAVERVAERVGYADVAGFRRVFERETALTPAQYRRRFQRNNSATIQR